MHGELRFRAFVYATLWGQCVSWGRNAGKVTFQDVRTQPPAEIMRVEGAECRESFFLGMDIWMSMQMVDVHSFSSTQCDKIALFFKSFMKNVRFGIVDSHFLLRSCGKRSFRKCGFSFFVMVLNVRAGNMDSHLL